jgi:NADPH-dependent 2,4-dienoyl-CoA reductase/sulfur reductase-like enzyme
MTGESIVIVGAGAAGIAALEAFRQSDTTTPAVIISGEKMPNYSPCALPYLVAADLPRKHLPRLSEDFYKRMRVKPVFGSKVCCIHPERRSITLDNGKSLFYSKLLIATGSVPIIPSLPGIDAPLTGPSRQAKGVFAVDTLKNTVRITGYLSKNTVKRAAVIGAGFTGIETAMALAKQGIKVVIIELLDRILARILDADFARMAQQHLEALGIEVRLNTKLTGIAASTKGKNKGMVTGVITVAVDKPEQEVVIASPSRRGNLSGESAAELVIIAIGVKPNINFLQNSGITVNKGIIVDEHMRVLTCHSCESRNPEPNNDIYAAGDVAETTDYLTGERTISAIWPNAIDQGRVAGANMAGLDTVYPGANAINIININNQPIVSMGRIGGTGALTHQNAQAMRRMYLDNNRVTGFEAIGQTRNLGFIWSCITKRTDISPIKDKLLKDNFIPYR